MMSIASTLVNWIILLMIMMKMRMMLMMHRTGIKEIMTNNIIQEINSPAGLKAMSHMMAMAMVATIGVIDSPFLQTWKQLRKEYS